MSQTSLQYGLEFQNLHCILSIVFVPSLNNGTTLLCILNQLIPMTVFLETKRRKKITSQRNTRMLGKQRFQLSLLNK